MNTMTKTTNSAIWEVRTVQGIFTIYFPCAVFNKEDNFMRIPETIRDFEFLPIPEGASHEVEACISQLNKTALGKALDKAICFGTCIPQGRISLDWDMKKVYVN